MIPVHAMLCIKTLRGHRSDTTLVIIYESLCVASNWLQLNGVYTWYILLILTADPVGHLGSLTKMAQWVIGGSPGYVRAYPQEHLLNAGFEYFEPFLVSRASSTTTEINGILYRLVRFGPKINFGPAQNDRGT